MTVPLRPFPKVICAISLVLAQALGQEVVTNTETALATEPAAVVALQPTWIAWGSVYTGLGFRDNVLLSHVSEERSVFLRGGIDATAWNVRRDRVDFWASVRASGTRYFSAQPANHEEQVFLLSELNYRTSPVFKFSLDGSASYSHLIYDVSETDLLQDVSEIKRSSAGLGPKIRWTPRPAWWIEAQSVVRRETYPDGFNNRSVLDSSLRFGWKPGPRFEASLAGQEWRRDYDVREQYSITGRPDGGRLGIVEHEGELRLNVTLDAASRWKSTTRASVARFADNGTGFLDYDERKVRQEIEWTADNWLVELEASARRLEYRLQKVGIGDPPPRVRDAYYARLAIERKLTPRWTVYAEYSWERNRCNDPVASYSMNEGLLGLRWNWEK